MNMQQEARARAAREAATNRRIKAEDRETAEEEEEVTFPEFRLGGKIQTLFL